MLQGSGDARMQPLYFLITTAGNDTNSICWEVHQKALDIQAGRKIDPTFYSVIYGASEDEDWTDPAVWKKANPSLGITVGIDKVRAACLSAQQNPGEENAFRQLRLNQWVKQSVRWMPMEKWDACAFPVSEDDLEGRVCYGGLDLSSTTDITAFVLVFPPGDDDSRYSILPYFWVPEKTLQLRVWRDHVPYDLRERQGFIMTTEGNVVHYGFIEKLIEKLGERFNIREIAFDRWGAVQMVQNLENMGFTVVPFGQGFNLDWLKNRLDDSRLKRFDHWLAQWASAPTYDGAFGMWQNSSKGSVNGISGNVDTDVAYKDYPSVIKGAKLNGFTSSDQKPSVPAQPEEPAPQPSASFRKGDLVKITGTKYYSGKTIPAWVKAKNWYVLQADGARVVIDRSEDGKNAICSPVNAADLQLVTAVPQKTVDELAREVIRGLWGNGAERRNRLTAAGYDYDAVQKRVNELLK